MDPEGFVLGPRAKRAISLVAAALTVIVAGSLVYLHQSAPLPARFVGVPPPPELRSGYGATFEFIDSQHGFAAVSASNFSAPLTIFRTIDGAHSWRAVAQMAAEAQVLSMHFWDLTHGLLEADHVYTTNDSGAHWTLISMPDNTRTYIFASPRQGWAVDAGRVFATDDGGLTWRMRGLIPDWSNAYNGSGLRAVDFSPGGQGWAGGSTNLPMVRSSSDGGATWTARVLPFRTSMIPGGKPLFFETAVRSLPHGAAFAFATDPFGEAQSFVSFDGGLTWKETRLPWQGLELQVAAVSFVDARDWWASSRGLLERTNDAGNTWKSIETVMPLVLYDMDAGPIHMVDAKFGWVAVTGPGGTSLLESNDGGHNWTLVNIPQPV